MLQLKVCGLWYRVVRDRSHYHDEGRQVTLRNTALFISFQCLRAAVGPLSSPYLARVM